MCKAQSRILAILAILVPLSVTHAVDFIPWHTDLDSATEIARAENRPLILHFWSPDSADCQRLETTVFNRKSVAETLSDFFVPVKVNATAAASLRAKYGIQRFPTDVVLSPNGEVLHQMRTPPNPQQYVAQLSAIAFRSGLVPRKKQSRDSDSQFLRARAGESYEQFDPQEAIEQAERMDSNLQAANVDNNAAIDRNDMHAGGQREMVNPYVRNNRSPESARDRDQAHAATKLDQDDRRFANGFDRRPNNQQYQNKAMQSAPQARPRAARAQAPMKSQRPPLGLDGYCPVTLIKQDEWKQGDPRWGVVHRGRLYYFAGKREKDIFYKSPDEYSPVLAGLDPVALTETGNPVDGKRAHGVVYQKQVYLFSSEENLNRFWHNPKPYVNSVMQAMLGPRGSRMYR